MAIPNPAYWYVSYGNGSSTGYYAVTAWATGAAKVVGQFVRQSAAPSVGNERVFMCTIAGTTHASTEPTWVVTKGAATTDNTVTWTECTGQAALNGSLTNTSGWTSGPNGVGTGVKNQAVALGYIIARDSGASYQICTTAGTAGNGAEPSFSNTAGTTTADNTVTWTSLGIVSNFVTAFGAPHARVVNAVASGWGAAGDNFYIGDTSAETTSAAQTITAPGTLALPNYFYSVDHTKTTPVAADLLAGATITTTGNSNLSLVGFYYWYGTTFQAGTSTNAARVLVGTTSVAWQRYDSCAFQKLGTSASTSAITFGQSSVTGQTMIEANNCTVKFGATGDSIAMTNGQLIWKNTTSAISGATLPTSLFAGTSTTAGEVLLDGIDLSALGSGKTLFAAGSSPIFVQLVRCRLGASVTVAGTPTGHQGEQIDLINCDSGTVTSRQERYRYQGTQTLETTIVRSGGASDGTTPMSWKVISTANSTWTAPYYCFPIAIWNATTGSSVTATVEIVNDGSTLTNAQVWGEVEYFGSASTTLASFTNNGTATNITSGTNLTTSSVTWTTTGLGSPIKQKLAVTFTPQLAGYLYFTVYVAKASQTLYVDPLVTLS